MEKVRSFHLAGFYCNPQVESHENWSVLVLFLFGLIYLTAV
jgi:hypothetical protein